MYIYRYIFSSRTCLLNINENNFQDPARGPGMGNFLHSSFLQSSCLFRN